MEQSNVHFMALYEIYVFSFSDRKSTTGERGPKGPNRVFPVPTGPVVSERKIKTRQHPLTPLVLLFLLCNSNQQQKYFRGTTNE
jgi:hypothetical protein